MFCLNTSSLIWSSVMLFSSNEAANPADEQVANDANTYHPFKLVDSTVTRRITEELESLGDMSDKSEERTCTRFN